MALPFKNGFELAKAMGYGKMYIASKQGEKENIQTESKKIIRITESDVHRMVMETVGKILNEVGETDGGQELLGRLAAKKSFGGNYNDYSNVMDYAKGKRNGDLKKSDKFAKAFNTEKERLRDEKNKKGEN